MSQVSWEILFIQVEVTPIQKIIIIQIKGNPKLSQSKSVVLSSMILQEPQDKHEEDINMKHKI